MKKLWKRVLSYTIDMLVVLVIVQSLSGIPALNKNLNDYTKYYNEYTKLTEDYTGFRLQLTTDFKDKKLSKKEFESLCQKYPNYQELLKKYYQVDTLSEKNYNKLISKVDESYKTDYKEIYYQIEQNSIVYFIIYLIVVFAYFVGFNKITNGQTLGKKLTRLKIVNSKDSMSPVPVWSYIVRTLLLYQPIYYIAKLIGIFTLDKSSYYTVTSYIYDFQYYLELIIIIMITIRADGRGLHDILAQTRVALIDKNGQEIEETSKIIRTKKLEDTKIVNK